MEREAEEASSSRTVTPSYSWRDYSILDKGCHNNERESFLHVNEKVNVEDVWMDSRDEKIFLFLSFF